MSKTLQNFKELLELNIAQSGYSKNLILLYTEEYQRIAQSIFDVLNPSLNASLKKINSIFDTHLEKYILENDIFLLFFSMPWENIKTYHERVRPILTRHIKRSYIVRDSLNDFNKIYARPYGEINQLHNELIQLGNKTKKVIIKNNLGTELEFTFGERTPWRKTDGTNLPNEIVPSEISNYTPIVNGKVVFTGSVVSLVPIGKKYGKIIDPIRFDIEDGFIKKISCENKSIETDLLKILNHCEGNREIVELGIGTNLSIDLVGINAPFEERKAGFHLGIGGYHPKSQHIDFVFDSSEIYFDGQCVFSNNQFSCI